MTAAYFELAITVEGGNPTRGVRFCIPSTENGWQGGTMNSFFKSKNKNFIAVGDKFVVKIVGWNCATQEPDSTIKRRKVLSPRSVDDLPDAITVTGGKFLQTHNI